jgi:hypothetical protein
MAHKRFLFFGANNYTLIGLHWRRSVQQLFSIGQAKTTGYTLPTSLWTQEKWVSPKGKEGFLWFGSLAITLCPGGGFHSLLYKL